MPYWSIYSTIDNVNWKQECNIMPEETFIGKGSKIMLGNRHCYPKREILLLFLTWEVECGFLEADKPGGPYRDVLKKPLIPEYFSVNHEYDPTAFTDDNGKQYLIFGRDGFDEKNHIHYQIARLSDDMILLAEKPQDMLTDKPYGFGGEIRARDHQYFHKHNGIYYLSCAGAYMTSDIIYGP